MTKKIESILVLSWLFIAIPLLFISYGSDPDTGLIAEASSKIWKYGEYFKSRTTGFPLYEILVSPLVTYGKWYLSNLLSISFGLAHLLGLLYLARKKEFNHPLLIILCLAFSPLIIKNSTSTMDYMGALALLTWSYVLMRQDKYFISAILIGIAAGFRPNSGLFIIPVLFYAWKNKKEISYLVKMYFLALVTGAILYSPVLFKYGIPHSPYIPSDLFSKVLLFGFNYLSFFGIITSLIIYPTLIYIFFSQKENRSPFILFHFLNILVWFGMFILIPYETEFLLPALLSVILLFDKYVSRQLFSIITISLLSYHFIEFDLIAGSSGGRYMAPSFKEGYSIRDIRHRIFQNSLRRVATRFQVTQPTLLTFGASFIPVTNDEWGYEKKHNLFKQKNGLLYAQKGELICPRLQELSNYGYKIIVWNDMKSSLIHCKNWKSHTELIYDLDRFFGTHIRGKAITSE